jgi:choline-sulfatase
VNLYDETIRVPLVIAGPGVAPGRVGTQAEGIDLFPTVATLLGFAPPPAAPGRNLLAAREPRPAFSELGGGLVAVRAERWKLIGKPGDGGWRLYDLATDPGERVDRFAAASEGRELEEQLARWRDAAPAPPAATGRDPQLVEKLRALGYVDP